MVDRKKESKIDRQMDRQIDRKIDRPNKKKNKTKERKIRETKEKRSDQIDKEGRCDCIRFGQIEKQKERKIERQIKKMK